MIQDTADFVECVCPVCKDVFLFVVDYKSSMVKVHYERVKFHQANIDHILNCTHKEMYGTSLRGA